MPGKKNQTPDNLPVVVIDLQYLPPVPYFILLQRSRRVSLDLNEHFIKQSYRNRCTIMTSNGMHDLVVPLSKPHQHVPVNNIRIDRSQHWARDHWTAIKSAYGKSPWFLHYSGDIQDLLMEENIFLKDLNINLLKYILGILGMNTKLNFTSSYEKKMPENILDLRSVIHPKKEITALTFYKPVTYPQNFGVKFVPSLSIIDLVFNEGPHSPEILAGCYIPQNQENN